MSVSGAPANRPLIPVYPPLPTQVPDDVEYNGGHKDQARFDMIVIGAGINGAGIARDAAERGLKVLLVDKGDFGAETTAHSTRLIHGGLRYLENLTKVFKGDFAALGDLALVYESLHEREVLLKTAPHLVRPLKLGIPVYSGARQRPKWYVKLGMVGYDVLSMGKSVPSHDMLSRDEFIRQFPGIRTENLEGGAVYYDGQVNLTERLTLENAIAAQETGNADIRTHTKVDEVTVSNRQATGVVFTDLLTNERFEAQGKVIVNAAGPWVDEIAKLAVKVDGGQPADNIQPPARRIGGVEGTHIIVKRWEGAPTQALYVEAESNGRPYFIVPWQKDKMLIGTTEEYYEGDPDKVKATEKEVQYLLRETNRVLPGANLTRDKILYTYSGIRPLPYVEPPKGRKLPGKGTANKITRKHIIADHINDPTLPLSGFMSIISGKITTYRNLSRQAVDKAVESYSLSLRDDLNWWGHDFPVHPSNTKSKDLPGGESIKGDIENYKQREVSKAATDYNVPATLVSDLIDIYGSRYKNVLDEARIEPALFEPIIPGSPNIKAQVVYAVKHEMARTVDDVLRRMGSHLNDNLGLDEADAVSEILKERCGFNVADLDQQIAAYRAMVTEKHKLPSQG